LRITKAELATAPNPGALVPFLNSGLSLGTIIASAEGRALEAGHYVQSRTGHRTPVAALELACLAAVDGKSSLREIGEKVSTTADPVAVFEGLKRRGFVSFGFGTARLKREVYLEPHGDRFLVYAPIRNIAFAVNASAAAFLEALASGVDEVPEAFRDLFAFVESLGLTGSDDPVPEADLEEPFAPTSVYLLLTSACNLRCQYCFSSGGDGAANLPQSVAMAAIDLIVGNAAKRLEPVKVRFHGGGEPTLRWEVLTSTTAYARSEAKKHGLKAVIGLNTNGLLGEAQVNWIAEHVDSIYLSFDGPPQVQDLQRPMRSGGGSCGAVLQTMERLTLAGRAFAIRSTVTRESCPHLKELVELVAPFNVSGIELEPMTLCGRAYEGGCQAPSAEEFIQGYLAAHERAHGLGVKLSYSGLRLGGIASTYCGAAGRNFAVTPTGHCTLCHRVCDPAHPGAEAFIYGAYDEIGKGFSLDLAKIAQARRLHCNTSVACVHCFAKWNCGGGCYAQNQEEAGQMLLHQRNDRCTMTQALTRVELAKRIDAIPTLSFCQ
ncbi:MAG: radical SAM protein, partial [Holophaga sp.]